MSKRSKRRQKRFAEALNPERNTQAPEDTPFLLMSGWGGADHSERRGFIYWHHSADSRREMPARADAEIRRRSHALYQNFGVARRIVRGSAQLVGFLTPQPSTADDAWNEEAFDYFQFSAGSPFVYDARGRYDFYTGQIATNIERAKDGRVLGVLTESPGGLARMAFYGAHQIRGGDPKRGWEEGILTDKFDRHLAYAVSSAKNPDKGATVSARDALYFGNWDAMGRIHGLPLLSHAVANLMDVVEIDSNTKHAIKINSELGLVVETDNGPAIQLGTGGLVGVPGYRTVDVEEASEVDDGNGGTETVIETVKKKISWESVVGAGGIPNLKPGQKVKVVHDERPGPNREAFTQRLIDHCIFGSDLPPAALYYLADLKGPGVRYSMEQIRRFVVLRHRQMALECRRFYVYSLAKGMKSGRLRQGPDGWWNKVIWLGLPDPTIDSGRDGALSVTRLESGLTTWADEWAASGEFGKSKVGQRIREVAWAKSEAIRAGKEFGVDLSLSEVMPRMKAA